MNNKLQSLITLFNERITFFNNHPDSYHFVRSVFGQRLPEGTEIEIIVKKPQEDNASTKIVIDAVDKKFVDGISDILKND